MKKESRLFVRFNGERGQQKIKPEDKDAICACCCAVVEALCAKGNYEVELTVAGQKKIKKLNALHRGKNSVTDVLSFPLSSGGIYDINPESGRFMLGDIVICYDRAGEQAVEYGHGLRRELCFLAVHSMLHLIGYDHTKDNEAKKMRDTEEAILSSMGVNR